MKARRYQPRPPGKKPVPLVAPFSVVGASSMLQSCGTAISRHPESSYPGAAASVYSPVGSVIPPGLTSAKRQPSRSATVRRPDAFRADSAA